MAALVGSPGAGRGTSARSVAAPAQADLRGPRRFARRGLTGAGRRFRVATEQLDTGAPVVSVQGEVDRATVLALEQTLLGVAEDRTGDVIVDLTGCSFLDSRGLGALNATRARLERSKRRLALVLSNPSVLRIFQITQFDQLFEIYPSLGRPPRPRQRRRPWLAGASASARRRRVPATTTSRRARARASTACAGGRALSGASAATEAAHARSGSHSRNTSRCAPTPPTLPSRATTRTPRASN